MSTNILVPRAPKTSRSATSAETGRLRAATTTSLGQKSGMLMKKRVSTAWKQRFCVLRGSTFEYYKDPSMKKSLGRFEVASANIILQVAARDSPSPVK